MTSIRKSIVSYTSSVMYCRLVAIVQSLIVIRWMEPRDLGIWLTLQLITIYGAHAHLGMLNAVNRQLPLHRGREEFDRAERIENVARGSLSLMMLVGLGAVVIMAFAGVGASDYGRGAIALAFTAIVTLGVEFHLGVFRSRNEFGRAGMAGVVNATAILAGLPLVYYWRYDGLLWRVAIAAVITLVVCLGLNRWNVAVAFDWKETRALIRTGAPILVVVLGLAAFAAMDRTLIAWLLDEQAMGHYAICFAVARIMKMFPTTFGQVFYPRMTAIYAREGLSPALLRRCVQASLLSLAVVLVVGAGALVALPWAVESLFPKYLPGLPALRIALIAYVILSLAAGPTYFLISTMQKRRQLAALVAGGVTMVLFAAQFAPRTLEGIAWSLVAGTVVYIAGVWAVVAGSVSRARAASA